MKQNKRLRLVIDDQVEFDNSKLPSWTRKAIEHIQALPDGKLLTRRALAERTGVTPAYTKLHTPHPAMVELQVKHNGACLFGNPRTIQAAREQLN